MTDELNTKIAQMLGVNPNDAPNWAGNIRHAWKLMEEMNAIDSPVDWKIFHDTLFYKFGLLIGHPEKDACYSICQAILHAVKTKDVR